jgi:hypothetical protein
LPCSCVAKEDPDELRATQIGQWNIDISFVILAQSTCPKIRNP